MMLVREEGSVVFWGGVKESRVERWGWVGW